MGILSKHLQDRCAQRGIDTDDVLAVVEHHSMSWEDPAEQSLVLTGTSSNGRTLRVCLVHPPRDGKVLVKTAFYVD